MSAPDAVPFVKWAGGKRSLLHRLLHHAPKKIRTYHEPFVGGGALFYALRAEDRFSKARLNDANERLMRTYGAVQKDVEGVIRRLRRMPNEEEFFYRTRARRIDKEVHSAVAAWLLYLNRTCFNGLYRVNKKGDFNAPFGKYENPTICNAENLRACSRALAGVKLTSVDFMAAAMHATEGDFVYFDPPYLPRSGAGTEFTTYTKDHFGIEEHRVLRDTARELKSSGVRVLVSNSGAEEIRELYAEGFEVEEVRGARNIGKDQFCRGAMPDLLIW